MLDPHRATPLNNPHPIPTMNRVCLPGCLLLRGFSTRGAGSVYKVVDPTFGERRFMTAETINLGASGVFLVPSRSVPLAWRPITDAEARQILGRGNPNIQGDGDNQPCDQPCPPGCPLEVIPTPAVPHKVRASWNSALRWLSCRRDNLCESQFRRTEDSRMDELRESPLSSDINTQRPTSQ